MLVSQYLGRFVPPAASREAMSFGRAIWQRAISRSAARAYCDSSKTVAIEASPLLTRRFAESIEEPVEHEGLMREMARHIRFHGPLTVKEFMSVALTHPKYGYYMRGDIFGRSGDFVTSPEVSQAFGELLGIWCVACWQELGRPAALRLAELGPGRGTLMSDLLRSTAVFPEFQASLSVHLVEMSPHLRQQQRAMLSGLEAAKVSDGAEAVDLESPITWGARHGNGDGVQV